MGDVARPQPHLRQKDALVPLDEAVRNVIVQVAASELADDDGDDGGGVDGRGDVRGVAESAGDDGLPD